MIIVKNKNAKTIEEVQANVEDIARQAVSREVLVDVPDLKSGTIDTGNTETDEIILSIHNTLSKLITNIRAQ